MVLVLVFGHVTDWIITFLWDIFNDDELVYVSGKFRTSRKAGSISRRSRRISTRHSRETHRSVRRVQTSIVCRSVVMVVCFVFASTGFEGETAGVRGCQQRPDCNALLLLAQRSRLRLSSNALAGVGSRYLAAASFSCFCFFFQINVFNSKKRFDLLDTVSAVSDRSRSNMTGCSACSCWPT